MHTLLGFSRPASLKSSETPTASRRSLEGRAAG
jgi:hypothetical protein